MIRKRKLSSERSASRADVVESTVAVNENERASSCTDRGSATIQQTKYLDFNNEASILTK